MGEMFPLRKNGAPKIDWRDTALYQQAFQ
jgi:hypothetical protein